MEADARRRERTLDLQGPLFMVEYAGGDSVPLLMVHGLGGSHLNWEPIAPSFDDHRILIPDLPGFGYTPPAGRSVSVRSQRDLLARLLEEEKAAPAVVIGNSMGGLIAMLLAQHRPDLVAGLVLVDPALPAPNWKIPPATLTRIVVPQLPGIGPRLMQKFYVERSVDELLDETLEVMLADPNRIPETYRKAAEEMLRERLKLPYVTEVFAEAARSITKELISRRHFRRMLHAIACPTLLVHGRVDRIVDVAAAEWVASERPDWDVAILDDIGHVPQIEDPEGFVTLTHPWIHRAVEAQIETHAQAG